MIIMEFHMLPWAAGPRRCSEQHRKYESSFFPSVHATAVLIKFTYLFTGKKFTADLHVSLAVLKVRHMARVFQRNPLDLRDVFEPWFDRAVGDLVVTTVEKQGLNVDVVRILPALPVFDGAGNDELGRALTACVDYLR